jgi:salicylate hydroxylase
VRKARNGRDLVRIPLHAMEERYGSPFWVVHRGDLQSVLVRAAQEHPDIEITLGARVEDFATHANGITVEARTGIESVDRHGIALIGADGLWSAVCGRLRRWSEPRFTRRVAWRSLVPVEQLAPEYGERVINLWLGRRSHLVHYPVKGGALINVVAIVADRWHEQNWSVPGERGELWEHFPYQRWCWPARAILNVPEQWLKWALFERRPLRRWGKGPVTLLGDAAHPMLPFLAQGAAMAIEDAAVLAEALSARPENVESALRAYEGMRRRRTARAQRASHRTGSTYHLAGVEAVLRNFALRRMGGERLLSRYDWLYDWRGA